MPNWERPIENTLRCRVSSEEQTNDLGREVSGSLKAGDVLALIGDLGAGKTRFVKAVAQAFGVPLDDVNSPTFTLVHEYEGRLPIRHCDTYRLRTAEEFADLCLDELFDSDCIALVEWADRVQAYLPADRIEVRIGIETPTSRTFDFTATGQRSREFLAQMLAGRCCD